MNVATITGIFALVDKYSSVIASIATNTSKSVKDIETAAAKAGASVEQSMNKATAAVGGGKSGSGGLFSSLGGLRGVIATLGVAALARSALDSAGRMADLSAATGLSVRELGRFKAVGGDVGVTVEVIADLVQQLQRRLVGGDASASAAFQELGLDVFKLKQLRPAELFETVAGALAKVENSAKLTTLATDTMGVRAGKQIPLLRRDLKQLGDEAERTGRVMSEETVAALDKAGDEIDRIKGRITIFVADALVQMERGFDNLWRAIKTGISPLTEFHDALKMIYDLRPSHVQLPDVPLPPGMPMPKPGGLPAGALDFEAAMERSRELDEQLEESQKRMKKAADAAEAYRQKIRGIADEFSGARIANDVKDVSAAILQLEKQGPLSAEALDRIGDRAVELSAEGAVLTDTLLRVWIAQERWREGMPQVSADLTVITARTKDLWQEVEKFHDVHTAGIRSITKVGGIGDIMNNLPGFKVDIGKPEGATRAVTDFIQKDIGKVIVGAFQGGGNPLNSIASAFGSFFGSKDSTLGKAMSGGLTNLFGKTFGGAISSMLPGLGALLGPLATKVTGWIGNLFGGDKKKAKGLVDQFVGDMGGLEQLKKLAAEAGISLDRLLSAKKSNVAEAEIQKITAALQKQQEETARLEAAIEKYGLSWKDAGAEARAAKIGDLAKDLIADHELLIRKGYDAQAVIVGMSGSLNDFFNAALTTGTTIPASMQPMLESLIRAGKLTEENARLLLGLPASGVPAFADIQAAAERYGIEVDKLGPKIAQIRITEQATQMIADFDLLVGAGANVGAVLKGMQTKAQGFIDHALKFGTELPASMQPMLQKMIEAGLLVDEDGKKLKDLAGVKFAEPLSEAVDRLIAALDKLIGKLSTDTEKAMQYVTRDRTFKWKGQVDVDGNEVDESGSESATPGFAGGTGGKYVDFGRESLVRLHGRERVMTEAEGRSQGGGSLTLQLVLPDGRVIAETVVEEFPGVLRRMGLAS